MSGGLRIARQLYEGRDLLTTEQGEPTYTGDDVDFDPDPGAAVQTAGRWEVLLVEDGSEPLTTEDGLDWLYVWVTD